ncbi:MAG: hypothetical protein AUG90_00760 [Verrucomicrobia bacterium 13_1_20CM_4_55_9]|nr:MAG: hypothetical protein AUG90_00760 [Verrucomicrobia bacterium 13_1_20CM_4_55_9]
MGVESAPSDEVSYLAPPTTGPAQMVSPASQMSAVSDQRSESNESIQDLSSERWPKIDIDDSLRLLAFPPRLLRER